ncbi:TPA: hypothetical protein N0F65_010387 [Lagenidium giganteum]|uniref:Uncharacterized protein n=1 Tax=Lagenidium giganteum TaxID=4803 RepID=A0AAV2YT96_9STRA|nr:TPA: hypothetical protein N0F65_010387 [Lagenidium giganteum]
MGLIVAADVLILGACWHPQDVLDRFEQVEKKLAASEKKSEGAVSGVELREYQLKMLARLRHIRDTMEKEGSSLDQLRQERDEARKERDALQVQVNKLNYRVEHLKRHVVVNAESA